MKYAIFSISGTVRYGIHDPARWVETGATYELIERFHTLRAASASLKMRNDAVKTMRKDIERARKSGLFEAHFMETLEALRDAHGVPYGPYAVDRMNMVKRLIADRSASLQLEGFDKIAEDKRHLTNAKKYARAVQPTPGSTDAMTDAERDALRAKTVAMGYEPRF